VVVDAPLAGLGEHLEIEAVHRGVGTGEGVDPIAGPNQVQGARR
jgi:hypothetical protein